MLLVAISWLFILVVLWPFGYLVVSWITRHSREPQEHISVIHHFLAGFVCVSTLSILLNFFLPLNGTALLIVCATALAIYALKWQAAKTVLGRSIQKMKALSWGFWVVFTCLVLIALLKSASISEANDEGGYYLPYIRWIEQFQIIPGIANIEDRFGFNSSFHTISALFGFAWLGNGGWYDLNGLLLVLIGAFFLKQISTLFTKGAAPKLTAFASVLCLLFLMRNRLTSSSSDWSVMFFTELIFVMLLLKIQRKEMGKLDEHFYLILIYLAFTLTMKYTMAFLCLAGIMLLVGVYRSQGKLAWKPVALLGVLIIAPWLARFPILTGYLVFPLYQIDLIDPDWKVSRDVIKEQFYYVSEFAKTDADPEISEHFNKTRTIKEWFPMWLNRENLFNRGTFFLLCFCILASITQFIRSNVFRKQQTSWLDILTGILLLNIIIWFFKTPAFRFGWPIIILFMSIVLFRVISKMIQERHIRIIGIGLLVAFLTMNLTKTLIESVPQLKEMAIVPIPVPTVEYSTTILNGVEVHEAAGYPCWGTPAPCFHNGELDNALPRGSKAEDGFRTGQLNSIED